MSRGRILLVDDDEALCQALAELLVRRGFEVATQPSGDAGLAAFEAGDPDILVTDVNMAGMNGLDLCGRVVAMRPDVPVIVITAFGDFENAVRALRAGASDFVTKPCDADVLVLVLERALRYRGLEREVTRLRLAMAGGPAGSGILGESPAIASLRDLVARVARTDVTVLIAGESGTGKELVARAVHEQSDRSRGPFLAINCAAMPEALLESELFGHARGAFTDARTARTGIFFQADRGTVLLDEIGELPLGLQPKLLRALQERKARPVGGDREQPFDVRFVVATNRDLEEEVEHGRFREDLYYRLNVVQVDVPPLRSRGSDVLLLAQHFLGRTAERFGRAVTGITPDAAERLCAYEWPGNVRELANVVERGVALARYDRITVEDLPDRLRAWTRRPVLDAIDDASGVVTLDELERRYIARVLQSVGGNKAAAARVLGVDRKTLYRKLDHDG